jgi:thioredoxin reductase (NADPH)
MFASSDSYIPTTKVAIVGAGPIGLELAASLKRLGMDYLHFDARQIGYTMSWWPRNTYFFSTTERIEIAGIPAQTLTQQRMTGEEYLAYLRSIVEQLDLQIHTYEPVISIEPQEGGFLLRTRPQTGEKLYFSEKVVLVIGDMHRPNLLGIPGEDLPHVSHYFDDPHKYFRKRLLIVGGRNSAVEAALRCWRGGSQVTISYRRAEFDESIVKSHILPDLKTQIELGNIGFLPCSQLMAILPGEVVLEQAVDGEPGGLRRIIQPADFVLLNTGFAADNHLFEAAGVHLVGEQRAPEFNPDSMETNVPGLFVAGTAAAGTQKNYRLFIENCHEHVGKIVLELTGRWPEKLGTIPERKYELPLEDIQAN